VSNNSVGMRGEEVCKKHGKKEITSPASTLEYTEKPEGAGVLRTSLRSRQGKKTRGDHEGGACQKKETSRLAVLNFVSERGGRTKAGGTVSGSNYSNCTEEERRPDRNFRTLTKKEKKPEAPGDYRRMNHRQAKDKRKTGVLGKG